MKHLPGPNGMPEGWFQHFLSTMIVPGDMLPDQGARWRESWRPYAAQLWAEAWVAGAAYHAAVDPRPIRLTVSDEDGRALALPPVTPGTHWSDGLVAEELVQRFREQLEGLPDGPSEG